MKKDKLGIDVRFYVVMAFIFAALGQMLLCALLTGIIIFVVQDEWASRNSMQALFIVLLMTVISQIFGAVSLVGSIPFIGSVLSVGFSIINGLINLIPLFFAIVGLLKSIKGEEANIPVFSAWAQKAYGAMDK